MYIPIMKFMNGVITSIDRNNFLDIFDFVNSEDYFIDHQYKDNSPTLFYTNRYNKGKSYGRPSAIQVNQTTQMWLNENNIDYSLRLLTANQVEFIHNVYYITMNDVDDFVRLEFLFRTQEEAMMFKLSLN